jgi:hypothetical protein
LFGPWGKVSWRSFSNFYCAPDDRSPSVPGSRKFGAKQHPNAADVVLVEGFCLLPCFDARHVLAVLERVNRRVADKAMGPRTVKGFGEARYPSARRSWSKQQGNGSQGWIRTTDITVNNRSLYR